MGPRSVQATKSFALILLLAAATTAGSSARRSVRDHTLVSRELPRMTMAIDPRLDHLGAIEFDLQQVARVERQVFAGRERPGPPARLLIIQFESILPGKKGAYTFGLENPTRLGAHDYQTQVGFFNFDASAAARPGAEAERTRAFLAEKGWSVAGEDFIVTRYARVVDPQKRSEIILFYYENVRTLERTRRDLEAGGSHAHERAGLFRDVAARSRQGFTIRDEAGGASSARLPSAPLYIIPRDSLSSLPIGTPVEVALLNGGRVSGTSLGPRSNAEEFKVRAPARRAFAPPDTVEIPISDIEVAVSSAPLATGSELYSGPRRLGPLPRPGEALPDPIRPTITALTVVAVAGGIALLGMLAVKGER